MRLPQNTKTCNAVEQGFSLRYIFDRPVSQPSALQFYPLCPHLCLSPEKPVCVIAIYKQEAVVSPTPSALGAKWFSFPNNSYSEIYIPPSVIILFLIFILITEH